MTEWLILLLLSNPWIAPGTKISVCFTRYTIAGIFFSQRRQVGVAFTSSGGGGGLRQLFTMGKLQYSLGMSAFEQEGCPDSEDYFQQYYRVSLISSLVLPEFFSFTKFPPIFNSYRNDGWLHMYPNLNILGRICLTIPRLLWYLLIETLTHVWGEKTIWIYLSIFDEMLFRMAWTVIWLDSDLEQIDDAWNRHRNIYLIVIFLPIHTDSVIYLILAL